MLTVLTVGVVNGVVVAVVMVEAVGVVPEVVSGVLTVDSDAVVNDVGVIVLSVKHGIKCTIALTVSNIIYIYVDDATVNILIRHVNTVSYVGYLKTVFIIIIIIIFKVNSLLRLMCENDTERTRRLSCWRCCYCANCADGWCRKRCSCCSGHGRSRWCRFRIRHGGTYC